MNRAGRIALTLVAISAAGALGYRAGQSGFDLPALSNLQSVPWLRSIPWLKTKVATSSRTKPKASGPVIYYRDPDGQPVYSAEPRKTATGRDFVAVHASEDIGFDDDKAEAATEPAAPASMESKKVVYYRNPMGLPDTSPVPKKDSMGMDYIPVYAGEEEDGSTIKIAPGKLQRTGVRVEAASERVIARQLRVPGTVQPDERRISVVSVPTDAFVGRVESVTTGDHVHKGEPLVQIRSPDIAAAAIQLQMNPGLEGAKRRLENLAVPPEVIAEIERTRQVPPAFMWSSPRDGVVLVRNATEGMKMAAGDVLFRIADLSTVWVLADVPEYQLASVAPGQSATIRIRGLPGRTFQGRITVIHPHVMTETRTIKVRIEIPNPDGALHPDMYADVEIASRASKPVLAVPGSAIIDTGTRQIVILEKGEGRFEPRDVKLGIQGDNYTEIRSGIASGDRVVVAANFLIDAESNLKAALSGMTAAETTP